MSTFNESAAVLLVAASSFMLGCVLGVRFRGLLAVFGVRVAGAFVATALSLILGGAPGSPHWLSIAVSVSTFGYAPFALGWRLSAGRAPEARWTARLDVAGLAALTVAGLGVDALLQLEAHTIPVVVTTALLLLAYIGGSVYVATASRVRPELPIAAGLIAWLGFVLGLGAAVQPGVAALALAPLLILGANLHLPDVPLLQRL